MVLFMRTMSPLENHRVRPSLRKALAAAAAVCMASASTPALAATVNSPLQIGDAFSLNNNLNTLSQFRNGARQGGTVSFGTNDQLGGIFVDAAANLYLAQNDSTLTSPSVERISLGQTTSTVVL